MQETSTSNSIVFAGVGQAWLRANKPWALVCLPILLLFAVVIGISVYETFEERRFRVRVERMRAEGIPVDRASLIDWTRARARSEGVVAWSEISFVQRMLSHMRLKSPSRRGIPADADTGLYRALFLGTDNPDDEQIADYLEKLRPLFRMVEKAVELPSPVMQRNRLSSSGLLGFDGVQSELRLELMHALCHRQFERATAAMDLMFRVQDVVRAPNEKPNEDFGYDSYWEKRFEYLVISRSLSVELWDEPYLRGLMGRLKDDRSQKHQWRSMVIRNRALVLDEFSRFADEFASEIQRTDGARTMVRFVPIPRKLTTGFVKNRLLDGCEAFERVAELGGFQGLASKVDEVNKEYFGRDARYLLVNPIAYSFQRMGRTFSNTIASEDHRRLVQSALAVKLFKMTKGKWPQSLAELSGGDFTEEGISPGESQTVQGERFGYEVDGDSAFVWQYRTLNPATINNEKKEYLIVENLKSMRVALEEIEGAELVRIR